MGAPTVKNRHVPPLEGVGLRSVAEVVVVGDAQAQLGRIAGKRGRLIHRGRLPRRDQRSDRTSGLSDPRTSIRLWPLTSLPHWLSRSRKAG